MYDIVIVGGGAAGFAAAKAARKQHSDARILLVQAEAVLPYDRTRLSKELVSGVSPVTAAVSALKGYLSSGSYY